MTLHGKQLIGGNVSAEGREEFFGIDPTVCRVVYVLLSLMGLLTGVIVYLILWAVMPQRGYR